MGVLGRILEAKRIEVARLRLGGWDREVPAPGPWRHVRMTRAAGEPLRLISEIKLRSPSAGLLSSRLSVSDRARAYERGGAAMVSVLCDEPFFGGTFRHLAEARQATSLPILCKDFILDEVQLQAARLWGADAALLIVRCLDPGRVPDLLAAARELGLTALVEVTTEAEAEIALRAGADLVGVNARDLDTLELDVARAARVLGALPPAVTPLHLSGLRDPRAVAAVARTKAHGALVGEALMREDDPEPLLRSFVAAAGG